MWARLQLRSGGRLATRSRPPRAGRTGCDELSRLVDHATLFRVESDANDLSVLNECDGLLISLAPNRSRQVDLDCYRAVYLDGLKQIGSALRAAPARKAPLRVVHLSSCGVYGDQQGRDTDERSSLLDWTNISQCGAGLCRTVGALIAIRRHQCLHS